MTERRQSATRISGDHDVAGRATALRVVGPGADLPGARHAGGDVEVVLDGVIYNRGSLGIAGADAEVIARLYILHGMEGCLQRLNGDFAIALHDRRTHSLWLARDRFGLQPLYHAATGGGIAFASQPGPLLGLPGVSFDPEPSFLARFAGSHYRTFDNDVTASPYMDVAQLPAGHLLHWTNGKAQVSRWWGLVQGNDVEGDEATLAGTYRELLSDAVGIRTGSANRPGFTLSGGMDSSTVIANATLVTGRPQDAFSTVYKDPTFDEREDITPMLEDIVDVWHAVSVDDPDVMSTVAEMVAIHDEPVATATWLSHFRLVQQVADLGYDVLFGGLGGDELNAGEYEYFLFHFADLRRAGRQADLAAEIDAWVGYHDHPIHKKSRAVVEAQLATLVDLDIPGRCRPDRARLLRYAGAVNPGLWDLYSFEPVMDQPFSSYLKNRTYQDIVRETAPCCLRAEDRHVNAAGIRRADPFFDHRLAELMFRVPGDMKIRDGVTKRLLREATRGVLPEETRSRVKKTGWNAPAHQWFSGEGATALRDLIASQSFLDHGVYDVEEVRRLLDEHEQIVASGEARENHMMFFWQLVNLELWLVDLDWRRRSTRTDMNE